MPTETRIKLTPVLSSHVNTHQYARAYAEIIQGSLPTIIRTVPHELRKVYQIPEARIEKDRFTFSRANITVGPGETGTFETTAQTPEGSHYQLVTVDVCVCEVPWTLRDRVHQFGNWLSRKAYDAYNPDQHG